MTGYLGSDDGSSRRSVNYLLSIVFISVQLSTIIKFNEVRLDYRHMDIHIYPHTFECMCTRIFSFSVHDVYQYMAMTISLF